MPSSSGSDNEGPDPFKIPIINGRNYSILGGAVLGIKRAYSSVTLAVVYEG